MKLWDALPRLASLVGSKTPHELSERVYPWLVADFALRRGQAPLIKHNPLSSLADCATGFLAWLAAPLILLWFWQVSTPLHNPLLTIMLGLVSGAAVFVSIVSYCEMVINIYQRHEFWTRLLFPIIFGAGSAFAIAFIAIGIVWISFERTTGAFIRQVSGGRYELIASIDLRLAELSVRPSGWTPFDVWIEQFEQEFRRREGIAAEVAMGAEQQQLFLNEAIARRSAQLSELEVPSYRGRNFVGADFGRAFVAGADFREADLTSANLAEAVLEGIDLRYARLQGTDFRGAQLQLSNLSAANLQAASLRNAQLQMADLRNADLRGVDLELARLDRTSLDGAMLEGASLRGSRLDGASIRRARLEDSLLTDATLTGADVFGSNFAGAMLLRARLDGARVRQAIFEGAELRDAILVGADVSGSDFSKVSLAGASLKDAACSNAIFDAAILDDADMRCFDLVQDQLRLAVGNANTVLPTGLVVKSCIDQADLRKAEQSLFGHSTRSRRSFCEAGEPPQQFGDQME